jgi:alkanesulfonate monooxygenase SsuD/methylene tetrahydromethanopterin reductase-like flavin-dependent oxidoreductase (luciferase family)
VAVFLSQLASRTSRARIGSYLYVLPLHHAGLLAQETAVLDHLCADLTRFADRVMPELKRW